MVLKSPKTNCTIPVELSHLTADQRREAAFWALEQFDAATVDIFRPAPSVVKLGPDFGKAKPCFWFSSQKDANWFLLRWS